MNYKLILQKSLFSTDSPNLILSGTDKIDKLLDTNESITDYLKNKKKYILGRIYINLNLNKCIHQLEE